MEDFGNYNEEWARQHYLNYFTSLNYLSDLFNNLMDAKSHNSYYNVVMTRGAHKYKVTLSKSNDFFSSFSISDIKDFLIALDAYKEDGTTDIVEDDYHISTKFPYITIEEILESLVSSKPSYNMIISYDISKDNDRWVAEHLRYQKHIDSVKRTLSYLEEPSNKAISHIIDAYENKKNPKMIFNRINNIDTAKEYCIITMKLGWQSAIDILRGKLRVLTGDTIVFDAIKEYVNTYEFPDEFKSLIDDYKMYSKKGGFSQGNDNDEILNNLVKSIDSCDYVESYRIEIVDGFKEAYPSTAAKIYVECTNGNEGIIDIKSAYFGNIGEFYHLSIEDISDYTGTHTEYNKSIASTIKRIGYYFEQFARAIYYKNIDKCVTIIKV